MFTLNAIERLLRPSEFGDNSFPDIKDTIRAAFYRAVVEGLHYGLRLVSVFNNADSTHLFRLLGYPMGGSSLGGRQHQNVTFDLLSAETKSFLMKYLDSDGNPQHRIAIPYAKVEINFGPDCIDFANLVESYEESFEHLKQELIKTDNYKRMMENIFPMNRIFDVCGVYAMFILSTKPELLNMMNTAKSEILSNISMATLASGIDYANDSGSVVANIVQACTPALVESMENNNGSNGFKLPESIKNLGGFFETFGKVLEKQAKEFLVKVPRTLAQATDPAYRDMKSKVDSCELDGITFRQFAPATGTKTLNNGVSKRLRTYAPVNVAFPIDFSTSFVPFPPYIINYNQFKSSLLKLTNSIVKSGMLPPGAELVRDLAGDCSFLGPTSNAYGKFMVGPALLAMGVNQLSGDIGKYKTQCAPSDGENAGEIVELSPCGEDTTSGVTESTTASTSDPCAPKEDRPNTNTESSDNSC